MYIFRFLVASLRNNRIFRYDAVRYRRRYHYVFDVQAHSQRARAQFLDKLLRELSHVRQRVIEFGIRAVFQYLHAVAVERYRTVSVHGYRGARALGRIERFMRLVRKGFVSVAFGHTFKHAYCRISVEVLHYREIHSHVLALDDRHPVVSVGGIIERYAEAVVV